jgi:hypothetical protein
MGESDMPQAAGQVAKASATERAENALESVGKKGSKVKTAKKAFELAEHVHFGVVLCSAVGPSLLLAIRFVYLQVTEAALTLTQATINASETFWRFLVLTAPLTFAVAVILASIRRKWFSDTALVRVPFAGIVLVGSAYLSGWSGIGRAFDWEDVVLRSAWVSSNSMVSTLMEWLRLPFFALWQYCQVYGWTAFLLSVVAGCVLGSVVKERTTTAQ